MKNNKMLIRALSIGLILETGFICTIKTNKGVLTELEVIKSNLDNARIEIADKTNQINDLNYAFESINNEKNDLLNKIDVVNKKFTQYIDENMKIYYNNKDVYGKNVNTVEQHMRLLYDNMASIIGDLNK